MKKGKKKKNARKVNGLRKTLVMLLKKVKWTLVMKSHNRHPSLPSQMLMKKKKTHEATKNR